MVQLVDQVILLDKLEQPHRRQKSHVLPIFVRILRCYLLVGSCEKKQIEILHFTKVGDVWTCVTQVGASTKCLPSKWQDSRFVSIMNVVTQYCKPSQTHRYKPSQMVGL